jgi:diguanylate cyclase (GGDEF)-like protein
MVIYAAHYGGQHRALAHAAAASMMFGVALVLNPLPGALVAWIVVSLALFSVAESVGRVVDQLHRQISTDPLTGVLNRAGLVAAASRAIHLARRSGQPLAMVVLDLDDFKAVNDTWGHAEGDRVLKAVCASWLAHLRSGDVLARMGGDEFVAILPATEGMAACGVAERLIDTAGITCSTGVSVLQPDDDLDALLARADKDMYRAKAVRDMYREQAVSERDSATETDDQPITPLAEPA